jgi:hypothetical protein
MRRLILSLLCITLVWIGIQFITYSYLLWQLNSFKPKDLYSLQTFSQLKTWSSLYPHLSLGTYRLPYLYQAYQTINQGINVWDEAQTIMEQAGPLVNQSLSGNSIDRSQINQLFISLSNLNQQLQILDSTLNSPQTTQIASLLKKSETLNTVKNLLSEVQSKLNIVVSHQEIILSLLGYNSSQHYIVLLQNNMELWPTGGYLGSYADFWLDQGAIKDLTVQASDVPNGQIKGYVEAPTPISKYTHQGGTPGWRLRESNWNPDFPENFTTINWFFTEGGVEPIDVLVATNLIPVINLINKTKEIDIIDYNTKLTSANFYAVTQKNTSYNFFPGSTQKADFLSAVVRQLQLNIIEDFSNYALPLTEVFATSLGTNQIAFTSQNEVFKEFFSQLEIDNAISPLSCQDQTNNCLADYLYVNEANLGINKANCCIDRQFSDTITIHPDNSIEHQLSLNFTNHNPAIPNPPSAWGGGYRAYIRLYVPSSGNLENITNTSNDTPIPDSEITTSIIKDKLEIGFPILVPGNKAGGYQVQYSITSSDPELNYHEYQLALHKQSGIVSIPWDVEIITHGKESTSHQINLKKDTIIKNKL